MNAKLRKIAACAAAATLIVGVAGWSAVAKEDEPAWVPGDRFRGVSAASALAASVADLESATVRVEITGTTTTQFVGDVDLTGKRARADLRMPAPDAGTARASGPRVLVEGSDVWLRTEQGEPWARSTVDPDASLWAQRALSQVAGGVDLRGLLTDRRLAPRDMHYDAVFSEAGVVGGIFAVTVDAEVVSALVPGLQQSADGPVERVERVAGAVWLDPAGKLRRLQFAHGSTATTVTVLERNPGATVGRPQGEVVELESIMAAPGRTAAGGSQADATG